MKDNGMPSFVRYSFLLIFPKYWWHHNAGWDPSDDDYSSTGAGTCDRKRS